MTLPDAVTAAVLQFHGLCREMLSRDGFLMPTVHIFSGPIRASGVTAESFCIQSMAQTSAFTAPGDVERFYELARQAAVRLKSSLALLVLDAYWDDGGWKDVWIRTWDAERHRPGDVPGGPETRRAIRFAVHTPAEIGMTTMPYQRTESGIVFQEAEFTVVFPETVAAPFRLFPLPSMPDTAAM